MKRDDVLYESLDRIKLETERRSALYKRDENGIEFLNYGNPIQELRMAVATSEDVKKLMLDMIQEMDLDIVDFRVEKRKMIE